MQNQMHVSGFKRISSVILALPALLFLFSCSKNSVEMSGEDNPQASTSSQSASIQVVNSVEAVPFERTYYMPCANGGEGEEVLISGTLNIVRQVVRTEQGFKMTYNTNPQGLSGVGLTSGETFRASGGSPGTLTGSYETGQYTAFYHEQLRIIGPNSTFLVRYIFHVTITPDGEIVTRISEESSECL